MHGSGSFGFLPIEIYELVGRVTFVRIGTMVVNLAILAYLVIAKHLFGIRGPLPEDRLVETPLMSANAKAKPRVVTCSIR